MDDLFLELKVNCNFLSKKYLIFSSCKLLLNFSSSKPWIRIGSRSGSVFGLQCWTRFRASSLFLLLSCTGSDTASTVLPVYFASFFKFKDGVFHYIRTQFPRLPVYKYQGETGSKQFLIWSLCHCMNVETQEKICRTGIYSSAHNCKIVDS